MKPTIGRIVIYNVSDEQKRIMENSYKNTGKSCNVQSKLPAIVVAVWSETTVNLKVITDGNEDLWVTSVHQGDGQMEWNWPNITN
jgi:hypothetical protein